MIVLDASAAVVLVQGSTRPRLAAQRRILDEEVHIPHLFDVEVISAFRAQVRTGTTSVSNAARALGSVAELPLFRHGHEHLASRVWELRDDVSAYDGIYVALAEILRCPLLTADARLANAPGPGCPIEVLRS